MIGQTIASYRIQKKLVHAGPGEVYLARDIELGRKVVLKFLPQAIDSEPGAQERFASEAKSAAGIHHPNIVTVYRVGEHAGRPFIAMEYVKGRTLATMMAGESISTRDAVDIAIQICDGLGEAIKHGLSLRDLRTENIIIGRRGRVRIVDFGLASGLKYDAISPDESGFRSPERAGGESGDERSDVYAVGALLDEMVTEDRCQEIISRARAEDPADRYPNLVTLASDLSELLGRLSGGVYPRRFQTRALWPVLGVMLPAIAIVLLILLNPFARTSIPDGESNRLVIAVLPFENLGGAEDEYFADGITDEITTRLSRMQGLGVISRTSSRVYKHTQKSVREIGEELNADYLIEGTIRWDKSQDEDRVRITPQLIRVSDDTHVWGHNYEREITEIFIVQADIAAQIVTALDVTLLEGEQGVLTSQPTENIDAYQAYLQGVKQLDATGFSRDSFELGVQMFERAISLDPDFALAHARLSSIHSRMYHYGFDRTAERLARAMSAVEKAFALQPDLAEAHLALAYYHYWGRRDYEQALTSLEAARLQAPNNIEIMHVTAYVKRRQGDLERCVELIEESLGLSPLDAAASVTLGETYATLRRYGEGERALRRAITLAPDEFYPYTELALMYLRWRGDTGAARQVLAETPSTSNTEYFRARFLVELLERNYAAALECLDTCPSSELEAGAFYIPVTLYKGMVYQLQGETERARAAYEASRQILAEKLEQEPDDYRVHSALGLTLAGLGRSQDAVRHGERAVQLYPLTRDALEAPVMIIDLALIYAMVDRQEEALDRLDYVLSIPSIISTAWLAKDPRWDDLRQNPQFETLLQKHRVNSES